VEAVIGERIGRLPESLRGVLRVASVEGEVFTAEVVARVRGADSGDVVRDLSEDLDRRHRLVRAHGIRRLDPGPLDPDEVGGSGGKGGRRLSNYRFRHILFQRYLHNDLDEVERAHLHEAVGTALEALYGSRAEAMAGPAPAGAVAVQLAWHFQEAGMPEKAIGYLHQAGERAVQLSAYREGLAHLTEGLALLRSLPHSPNRDQLELLLQVALGIAMIGHRSYGSQGEAAYSRARELCEQMGETAQLSRVLSQLSIFRCVWAEHTTAHKLGEDALDLAEQAGDPLLVAAAHWCIGCTLAALGQFATARSHLQKVISFYVPQEHHRLFVTLRGSDVGVSALAHDACCLWCLGYPDQALQRSRDALALAQQLDHGLSRADVICYGGCLFNHMFRDVRALKRDAEELMRLSKGMGFKAFGATGRCYRGEALFRSGRVLEGIGQMREGLAVRQSRGIRCHVSGILAALAEALVKTGRPEEGLATLVEALALVEETDERYWEADLRRLKGDLLLRQGAEANAEASLHEAIAVAQRQGARSWELRATTSLARLWQKQGKRREARRMLAEVYDWFTEGFDTRDLKEARALLEELA
jgi:predicted ATPase